MKLPFDLKVGDYCTAYVKGIHQVVHILYPAQGRASTALVTLQSVLDKNMNPRKGHKSTCDVAWCTKINPQELLQEVQNSHLSQIENIKKYLI